MTPDVDTPQDATREPARGAGPAHHAAHAEPTTSGPTVVDPICGMRLAPADAAASAEHDGRTYHFCSRACRDTFTADPTSHAAPAAGHDAARAHDGHEPSAASRDETNTQRRTHGTRTR